MKDISLLSIEDAWKLIGEACYAYKNKQARHALMLIRADGNRLDGILQLPDSQERQ